MVLLLLREAIAVVNYHVTALLRYGLEATSAAQFWQVL
jgi:hypothetical protein